MVDVCACWQNPEAAVGPRCGECGPCKAVARLREENEKLVKSVFDGAAIANGLRAEKEALEANCPYPWCPECKCEVRLSDEDGCCNSCGASPLWPTAEHVELLVALVQRADEHDPEAPEIEKVRASLEPEGSD